LITVELERDLAEAGRTDMEACTTPYDVAAERIQKVVTERPRKLVEAVANEIAENDPLPEDGARVTVEVKKFSIRGLNLFPSRSAAPSEESMRTRWCWLLMVFVLAGIRAAADTVKLKDGTTLEGDITAENDTAVSIYLEFSGGTITQRERSTRRTLPGSSGGRPSRGPSMTMNACNVPSVQGQFQGRYYDQIINDVFRKFLAQHPNSPFATNVTERLMEWKAERNLVAAGNVKFHGRWSPIEEAAKAIEHEHGQQLLQQAQVSISQAGSNLPSNNFNRSFT